MADDKEKVTSDDLAFLFVAFSAVGSFWTYVLLCKLDAILEALKHVH